MIEKIHECYGLKIGWGMKRTICFIATFLVFQVANAQLNPVSKIWSLVDCGSGISNTDGCPDIDPTLNFTDLVSGPDTGLGDGLGSGTIVTVWGHGLGAIQGDSTIEFCDSLLICRTGYVYYWKNADGQLPGGPANLYESHEMQEIAFSIPDGADGAGTIRVTVGGEVSNTLPFTVRAGNIYWVQSGGNNANSCSYSEPCAFVDGGRSYPGYANALGNARMVAGDTVYSRGVAEPGQSSGGTTAGMYLRSLPGTAANQIAIVAYPNTRPTVSSPNQGVHPYIADGIVISKYSIEVGYADPAAAPTPGSTITSNWHIFTSRDGRAVGNHMTQISGTCFTGWNGAITSGGPAGNNYKIFGNHIEDLGCDNSSRYSHTMYMSIRDENSTVAAWEIGYNYLDNNNTLFGIHNYDETYAGDCGDMTGTLKIHNNVVVNQRGAGINVQTNDALAPEIACWASADYEITNNLLVNVGLGVPADEGVTDADAMRVTGDLTPSSVVVKNNTIFGYGEASSFANDQGYMLIIGSNFADPTVTIENNAFVQNNVNGNQHWFTTTEAITTDKNSFWNVITGDANSPPAWTNNITTDPLMTFSAGRISLGVTSPLIGAGNTAATTRDIYGYTRGTSIGVTEN